MSFRRVPPAEAHRLATEGGYKLVDVRSVPEFEAGHPAGAFNIPLMHRDPATGQMRPNPAFVAEFKAVFKPQEPLLLSCLSGGRSARAAQQLVEAGYTDVVDNKAGWGGEKDLSGRLVSKGWEAEGLPTEKGPGGDRSYAALTRKG